MPSTPAATAPAPASLVAAAVSDAAVTHLHTLLRVAVGLCFIGHGAFGIITKEAWLPYFGFVGIEPALAYRLMPVVGTIDILIGIAVLIRPLRASLAYAVIWCVWTAALRPLTGEGVWEMLERAGNYGVPLALLLLGGATHRPWPARLRSAGDGADGGLRLPLVLRTLQWTTALLLVGHGGLLLTAQPVFLAHWATLDVPTAAVPWIGGFEVLLALAVIVRPAAALFLLIALWKIGTEGLWLTTGAPAWEWIERAGSYAAPLGAALLIASGTVRAHGLECAARRASRVVVAPIGLLLLLFAPGALHAQLPPPDARLLDELRRGGMVLLCRHAITDHEQRDASVDFSNPLTQRRLSAEGEAQARELGELMRALRVPIADVHASPYHRNMRSAELSFGPATADHNLLTRGDSARQHRLLRGPIPAGGNRAIVTHERTIHLMLPTLRRGTIDEGVCVIVRPDGRRAIPMAQALPADWRRLLETR